MTSNYGCCFGVTTCVLVSVEAENETDERSMFAKRSCIATDLMNVRSICKLDVQP